MLRLVHLAVLGVILASIVASPLERSKRQVVFPNNAGSFGQNQGPFGVTNPDPTLVRGPFTGFGDFQPGQDFRGTGRGGLTIAGNGGTQVFIPANNPPPIGSQPGNGITSNGVVGGTFQSGFNQRGSRQIQTDPQLTTPATTVQNTTPSQAYLSCLSRCQTTMEYNPVCGSDARNYHNEQRLNCAQRCGMNVQLIRRGTCLPL